MCGFLTGELYDVGQPHESEVVGEGVWLPLGVQHDRGHVHYAPPVLVAVVQRVRAEDGLTVLHSNK